jgi:hypothetical protein
MTGILDEKNSPSMGYNLFAHVGFDTQPVDGALQTRTRIATLQDHESDQA